MAMNVMNLLLGLLLMPNIVLSYESKKHHRSLSPEVNFVDELKFVHVLFRHGDRTPISPYNNDPYKDPSLWPTGWGQLTNRGKKHQYELGQWLRDRYNSILSDTYSRENIYIHSTDVDRTLMSALSNLAGLYPPQNKDVWNDKIPWQPIPVHTVPEDDDAVLSAKKSCPSYERNYSELMASDEIAQINKKYQWVYDYATGFTGQPVNELLHAEYLYSTLFIEEFNGFKLPEWTKKIYPHPLEEIAGISFTTSTYNRQLARLKFGLLLKEILNRFTDKLNNKLDPDRSMWMYSAHDTTVAGLLNTLGVFNLLSPPFAACVLMELHLIDNEPRIKIFYKNTSTVAIPIEIPNCGFACPLDKMYQLYDPVLPSNWNEECKLDVLTMGIDEETLPPFVVSIVIAAFSLIATVLLVVGLLVYSGRKPRHLYVQLYS